MQRWKRLLVLSLFSVMVVMAAAGVASAEKTLVIGMNTGTIVTLDPAACYEVEGHWMLNNIYDSLVKFKPGSASEIEPCLATDWNVDGKTLKFQLREGVKFSNGHPLEAEDVVYSLKRVVAMGASPSWILTQFGVGEDDISAEGNTIKVEMDEPYSPQLVMSCMTYVSGVVEMSAWQEHEEDGDFGSAYLDRTSAGSGPYVLDSWSRNERIVLKANPHYWGEQPKIDRIVMVDIPESSSQLLQLKRGKIDIAWNLEYDQIPEVEQAEGLRTTVTPMFKQIYLAMNATKEPLDNVKVRQAVKSAIDTAGMVQAIGGGVSELHSFIPKGMFAHYAGDPFPHNPERARELLAEAGYPDGIEIDLTVPEFLATAGTVAKANLDAVGIKTNLQTMAYTTLLGKYRKQGLEVVIARWGADYGDPDAMAKPFAHCRTTGDDAKIKQLAWRNGYANPELTQMVEDAQFIQDTEKRAALYEEIQKKWLDEGVFEILYQFSGQIGLSDAVKNFHLNPLTETPLQIVELDK
ncbi:MAG: ABC transporter substrate-binding protein [Synergistales bacterium]|nr:ABC transporter substrate-binding protein [Synergistales bacterium]